MPNCCCGLKDLELHVCLCIGLTTNSNPPPAYLLARILPSTAGDPHQGVEEGDNRYGSPNSNWPVLETVQQGQVLEIKMGMYIWHWVRHFHGFR